MRKGYRYLKCFNVFIGFIGFNQGNSYYKFRIYIQTKHDLKRIKKKKEKQLDKKMINIFIIIFKFKKIQYKYYIKEF